MSKNVMNVRFILVIVISLLLEACFMKGEITSKSQLTGSGVVFSGAMSATNISGTAIQINWDLSIDPAVETYNIYLVNSDSSLQLIGTSNATTNLYIHSGLTTGLLYRYVVRTATSTGATDSNLNIVSGIPYAGLSSVNVIDATTADLFFSAAMEAINLNIYCSTGSSETMSLVATVSALTPNYHMTGLTTATLYNCKVKALLPDGSEDANAAISSFTPQTVSSSPLGFAGITSATNTSNSAALIQWAAATPDSGVTLSGYRIFQFNPDFSLDYYDIAANLTSYSVTGLSPGNNYTFTVRAVNAADSSTDGNLISITIFTYAGITSASPTSATSATLNFPAAPSASSLHIYCYESSSSPPSTPTASISSALTSYSLSALTTSTNYTCLVKAVGTAGEDGNTATATFTTP